MTGTRPASEGGGELSVQQVSRLTGLAASTLRYYEQIGLIDAVDRDPRSGHRRYSARDLERIEGLAHLRAAGLPIDGMRALMHARGHTPETAQTKADLLQAHRDALTTQITALQARQRYLDNRLAHWRAVSAGEHEAARQLAREEEALGAELS